MKSAETWKQEWMYEKKLTGPTKYRCPVCHTALDFNTDIVKLPSYDYRHDVRGHLACSDPSCLAQMILLGWHHG